MRKLYRKKCLALLKERGVPDNIVAHSLVVEKISLFLARELRKKGFAIDLSLVSAGALLHDIDKHETFDNGRHGEKSFKLLKKKGFPELAEIARSHLLQSVLGEHAPSTWEEKIVFYADKRVTHDEIVSLEERFAYLRKRYGKISGALERINASEPLVKEMEKQLFNEIELKPSDLKKLVV